MGARALCDLVSPSLASRRSLTHAPPRFLTPAVIQTFQLFTAGCTMISGWYGMNLDNGWCGPEGCRDATDDYGFPAWKTVVIGTSGACGLICLVCLFVIYRN